MSGVHLSAEVLQRISDKRKEKGNPTLTIEQVSRHNSKHDCLIVVNEMVFDVSSFLHKHPGGMSIILNQGGKDVSHIFFRNHSKHAHSFLPDLFCADLITSKKQDLDRITQIVKVKEIAAQIESPRKDSPRETSASLVYDVELSSPHGFVRERVTKFDSPRKSELDESPRSQRDSDLASDDDSTHGALNSQFSVPPVIIEETEAEVAGMEESPHNALDGHMLEEILFDVHSGRSSPTNRNPSKKMNGSNGKLESACPFMAIAMAHEAKQLENGHGNGESEITLSNSFKSANGDGGILAHMSGSFGSSKKLPINMLKPLHSLSSFSQRHGQSKDVAMESPRSVRSKEDLSSSKGGTSHGRNSSSFNHSRKSRGTNINKAGGVYRGRVRRKQHHTRKSQVPAVDMEEWGNHSYFIVTSWNKMLQKASYADLGLAIYDSVKDNETLEPLFRFTNKSVQGTKFVDMLSSIVENITSPADIYVKIAELAPMHHRKGVKGSHMPLMKEIILGVFKHTLGEDFSAEETKAWIWMWSYLSRALEHSLVDVGSTLGVVRESWEIILEKYDPAHLGEMVYDHLFKLAPNVTSLFTKSREYMAIKMGDMLCMLVSFADDPDNMKQQVSWLGLRHVNYKVRPHHIPLMGPVFMTVLAEASGEYWTEEMEKCWGIVFNMVCENMSEAIQDGEDYALSLEHTTQFMQERVDRSELSKVMRTELLVHCPSLFEKLEGDAASNERRNSLLERTKALRTASTTSSIDRTPSTQRDNQVDHGVSHLISSSATRRRDSVLDDAHNSSSQRGRQTRLKSTFTPVASCESDVEAQEEFAISIYDFTVEVAQLVWEPEKQLEQIFVYAPTFYACGMRSEHLKAIAQSLESGVASVIGEDWGEHMSDSLRWVWKMISDSLSSELDGLREKRSEIVLHQWQHMKDNVDVEYLGEVFWKHLNNISPEQTHLFRRSLRMWGSLLFHIMDMLVVSITEPADFFDQLFELTLRHVRYGVRSEYLNPFGQALIFTLQDIMETEFDEKSEKAWKEVWKKAANSMARGLNMGGNAITHALVEGNADALQEAISSAPRSKRDEWLCQIDINGAVISPLYWALHDGKYSIVEFILCDLLTIRADIHGYYYGRENLFSYHENLVEELGRECPHLMCTLLDGLLWHSKEKLPGRMVRVNYYIRDIYGDPDLQKDPWSSPLAHLINFGGNDVFKHPVVHKTLDLKWSKFGLKVFCLKECVYFAMIVFFMIGYVRDETLCDPQSETMRLVLTVFASLTLFAQVYVAFSHMRKNLMLPFSFGPFTFILPRTFASSWNLLRVVSCSLILVSFAGQHECNSCDSAVMNCTDVTNTTGAREFFVSSSWSLLAKAKGDATTSSTISSANVNDNRTSLAIAAVLLWAQMFQLSILSTPMAAFIYTIGIMFHDLSHSLFMIVILIFGFGSALTLIDDPPFDEGWDQSVVVLLQEVLGVAQPLYPDISALTRALLLIYVTCVNIGLLNILIAQLTITYDKLTADKEAFAMKHRASMCLDIECFIPLSWKRKIFCDLGFHLPLNFTASDVGPAGGIQEIEKDTCERYVPDRIMRFTGDASPEDPWPEVQ
uniref:Globin family profile domain-containing protein n=3 Tax=Guillardia theta TaxID=55529 RepID=A0A7S4PAX6_GUITH|mmetsp:Transcript_46897/g.146988  ORF Transcript_46897/g.146988 Transcript_46897/m.146988 type:complete len:1583 (+) Transcript_46897:90-4838(+)